MSHVGVVSSDLRVNAAKPCVIMESMWLCWLLPAFVTAMQLIGDEGHGHHTPVSYTEQPDVV